MFSFAVFCLLAVRNHAFGEAVFGTFELKQLLAGEYFGEFLEILSLDLRTNHRHLRHCFGGFGAVRRGKFCRLQKRTAFCGGFWGLSQREGAPHCADCAGRAKRLAAVLNENYVSGRGSGRSLCFCMGSRS